MPTPVLVVLVSMGPLALVFCAVGAFFRLRPRFEPFVRTEGMVVQSPAPHLGRVIRFTDSAGRETESLLIGWRVPPPLGTRLPIVYDRRNPSVVSREGPLTDGTIFFVLAAVILLVGVVIAGVAVLTGSR